MELLIFFQRAGRLILEKNQLLCLTSHLQTLSKHQCLLDHINIIFKLDNELELFADGRSFTNRRKMVEFPGIS